MIDRALSAEEIREIKENYPPGTRIQLIQMEDKWAVPSGTRGTVDHIDSLGQVHPKWDNGRSLAVVPQVDQFRKLTEQELQKEQGIRMEEQTL